MNQTLPIQNFREEILAAIRDNAAVVITAETGAGKSTQVPQYLLEAGYNMVVTQPRRLAARTVAQRVAQERGEELGGVVGFRTAYEREDSRATRCLFCTDGLALVRELMGAGTHGVLVLDEVHEWNMNLEVLVAWAKLQLSQNANFKVVLMSATLEAEKLASYFGGVPVIAVPGRLYPVEEKTPSARLVDDAATLLRAGRNVLVFQPGKAQIADTIRDLEAMPGLNAELLPLHGELTAEEQQKAFRHYGRPKCVVSTNVAQTSVTIDDIDAVVDSGTERRVELVDGVEGLYLKPVSLADSRQRKGRAGRTKPGVYIDHCGATDRPEFPKAEILRVRLDQTVLRLAEAGFDAEVLEFFHQPDKTEIHEAKRALKALGCMDQSGTVTAIGRRVAKMPISVKFARMVVEAERLGVVDDVIDVAAILEQGEITARKIRVGNGPTAREVDASSIWRQKFCPNEESSDIMAQLAVFTQAADMTNEDRRASGVFVKAYHQAREKRRHLADSLKGKVRDFQSTGNRENILKAVAAGMVDHLYRYDYGSYRNGDDTPRELNRDSVVRTAEWLVALPFDLEITTRRGKMMLRLVRMATKVDPMWLAEVAPQLVRQEVGLNPTYDPQKDSVVSTTRTFFGGQMVKEGPAETPDHPEASRVFAVWIANQMV
jgi:HrpA-like RNA helicase